MTVERATRWPGEKRNVRRQDGQATGETQREPGEADSVGSALVGTADRPGAGAGEEGVEEGVEEEGGEVADADGGYTATEERPEAAAGEAAAT